MKTLDKEKWNQLSCKKNLTGTGALHAVKQDGYALQYIKEQTNEICLAAVNQNGDAFRYVEERIFNEIEKESKSIMIDGKEVSEETILAALKAYFK